MQFLAIADPSQSHDTPDRDIPALIAREVAAVRSGYSEGFIRQAWLQQPGPGAVVVIEAPSIEDARSRVAALPLIASGVFQARVLELGPFQPFAGTPGTTS